MANGNSIFQPQAPAAEAPKRPMHGFLYIGGDENLNVVAARFEDFHNPEIIKEDIQTILQSLKAPHSGEIDGEGYFFNELCQVAYQNAAFKDALLEHGRDVLSAEQLQAIQSYVPVAANYALGGMVG